MGSVEAKTPLLDSVTTPEDLRLLDERDLRQLADVADRHTRGRLVSMLEGGYNLAALAKSVGVHVTALMEASA